MTNANHIRIKLYDDNIIIVMHCRGKNSARVKRLFLCELFPFPCKNSYPAYIVKTCAKLVPQNIVICSNKHYFTYYFIYLKPFRSYWYNSYDSFWSILSWRKQFESQCILRYETLPLFLEIIDQFISAFRRFQNLRLSI